MPDSHSFRPISRRADRSARVHSRTGARSTSMGLPTQYASPISSTLRRSHTAAWASSSRATSSSPSRARQSALFSATVTSGSPSSGSSPMSRIWE